jgi:hypothetical protein
MADLVFPYAVVPDHPGIYVCGCFERWVSIYTQGVRGLNLAWGLMQERVRPGGAVCVVGGGFSGLAVAAGLARRGARVTLLERNAELLTAQRHNRVRWIHPRIHEWPQAGSRDPRAGLPVLDWDAGLSADVAARVLDGFLAEAARAPIEVVTGAASVALAPGPTVAVGDAPPRPYAAVVLALGLGIERSFGALPLRSYWGDDTIAVPRPGPPRHHLVTGIGEGGVIDALYLRLVGFSHAELADRLAEIPRMAAVERELLHIEERIAPLPDDEATRLLGERYAELPVPPEADALLAGRARRDTRVTLNAPEPVPLAPHADIFNRFLISRLVALGELTYVAGKIDGIAEAGDGYDVVLDDGSRHRFDEVNIRHGTVPALRSAFPDIWDSYHPARIRLPHLLPAPQWPAGFFDI